VIRYRLACCNDHEFDAWFRNGAEYDRSVAERTLTCIICGSSNVAKAVMAPRLATAVQRQASAPEGASAPRSPSDIRRMIRELHETLQRKAENVGPRFAEEARQMHYSEVEGRAIYGEATREEASELIEEGIPVLPLPSLPDKSN
jgi:hypothetical protein